MSAQEATSIQVYREVGGKGQIFKTITSYENSKISNTKILRKIDKSN